MKDKHNLKQYTHDTEGVLSRQFAIDTIVEFEKVTFGDHKFLQSAWPSRISGDVAEEVSLLRSPPE